MKVRILFFIVSIMFSIQVMAQDIITRKDGSETKAKVIEIDSKNIKYKRFDNIEGPSYTEPKTDIVKIKYENGTEDVFSGIKTTAPKAEKRVPKLINSQRSLRYAGIVEVDFGIGMQTKETKMALGCGATLTQGIKIDEKHFVGIGAGIEGEGYIDGNGPYSYVPVYANYRYDFKYNQITPFVSVSAGWRAAVTKTDEVDGGVYSNVAIGVRFGKLIASVGTYAKTYRHKPDVNENNKDTYANLGVMFNIGISF